MKQNKLTVEQEEFIKMNYQNQSKLWIADQLHVKLEMVRQKIRSLKEIDQSKKPEHKKLTVEQEEFITMNYQNQSNRWIADQLHVKLQMVGQKIRSLKERDLAKKTDPIANLRIKLIELYEQLPNLKGKEWDEQVRRINNISVDIDLKRRQKALRNSSAHFGDEKPVYSIPKN